MDNQPEIHPDTTPDAKTAAIVDAAQRIFLAKGFDGASMDAIALAANVSKRTVYNRFRSKEELFGATIEETCRRVLPVNLAEAEVTQNPREFIETLARSFLKGILEPEAISLRRIATFEAGRKPELGQSYLEHGLYFMIDAGSEILSRIAARGDIVRTPNPRLAICQLGALITEPLYSEVLLGKTPENLDSAIERQLQTGLDAFWQLFGVAAE